MPEEKRADQVQSAVACFALGAIGIAIGLCTGRGVLDLLGFTAKTSSGAGARVSLFVVIISVVCLGGGVALVLAGFKSLANSAKRRKQEDDDATLPPSMSNRYR